MSFKEVNQLRKSGQLNEALTLAEEDLLRDPDNEWNKRAIVWVYYAFLKSAQEQDRSGDFLNWLEKIVNLQMPKTETYVFDSVAWSVGKLLFHTHNINNQLLDNLFGLINDLPFSRPGDAYSFMLKAFKKQGSEWDSFHDFVNWWDLNNLQDKDYENYITDSGKQLPSLAESIYVSVAKHLLKDPRDMEKIQAFIPKIAKVSKKYPQMQYPPYYYAKLLLAIGDKEHFMQAFLPFAKKKQRDFWVWDLMSGNFEENSEEYFSCLCKSLTCGSPDKFNGGVREKIAEVFVIKKMYPEAKYEFQKIIESRQKEGWQLRDKHFYWQNFKWWNNTIANQNNIKVYQENINQAQNLLFVNTKEEIAYVDYVNNEKKVFNFVVSKQKYGFSSFKQFDISLNKGDFLAIRFEEKNDLKSNFYKILSVMITDRTPSPDIFKKCDGILNRRQGNSFGFINNIFVPPQLIQKLKLQNGDKIHGFSLQSYNSKRKAWGWNLISISK